MTSILRETASGLLVKEEAADERAIGGALRQIDNRLVLQLRSPYYVVVKIVSDYEAPIVYTWKDKYGEPLPLSSGLVEEFKKLRLDAPNKPPSIDERNRLHREQLDRDWEARSEAVMDDHRARLDRGQVSVSIGNRAKRRYWQKQLPRSARAR